MEKNIETRRPDGSLFLASCAHERFSWIKARTDEADDLRAKGIRLFKPLGRTKSAQPAIPPETG